MSTSVPLGSTTIWLPTVKTSLFWLERLRGASQLAPPLVVRVKKISPRIATGGRCWGLAWSPGKRRRSHTAYTSAALVGSAVIDSLSLKGMPDESRIRVVGSLHASPPFVDLPTKMAEVLRSA